MKNRVDTAKEQFNKGFNCAQSVLSAFSDRMELSEEEALRLSSGFGAGIAELQNTCGAVTGAIMVIGALHDKGKEKEPNSDTYELIQKFVDDFIEEYDTINCRELMEIDFDNKEEVEEAIENGILEDKCLQYVKDAVNILESKYV